MIKSTTNTAYRAGNAPCSHESYMMNHNKQCSIHIKQAGQLRSMVLNTYTQKLRTVTGLPER